MSAAQAKPAVIVVNSQVARGSVGGRVTMFVLQRMGYPVWWVPTVNLPWHAGQGPAVRLCPGEADFAAFVGSLGDAPWLSEVGAIMTGYLGAATQVGPLVDLVEAVRAVNPDALYLCDPIIGDSEGLYQPEIIGEAIRSKLLPLADMTTPNRHELAWLTQTKPANNADLVAAARTLGPREAIVTSAFGGAQTIGNLLVERDGVRLVTHDEVEVAPYGTGDMVSALYLGHRLDGRAPADALDRAVSATYRLVRLAREIGVDEIPFVAGQDVVEFTPQDIAISALEAT